MTAPEFVYLGYGATKVEYRKLGDDERVEEYDQYCEQRLYYTGDLLRLFSVISKLSDTGVAYIGLTPKQINYMGVDEGEPRVFFYRQTGRKVSK